MFDVLRIDHFRGLEALLEELERCDALLELHNIPREELA